MIISKTKIDERASEGEQLRQIRAALYIMCEEVEAALDEVFRMIEGAGGLGGGSDEKGK